MSMSRISSSSSSSKISCATSSWAISSSETVVHSKGSVSSSSWWNACNLGNRLWHGPCLIHVIWSSSDPSRLDDNAHTLNDFLITSAVTFSRLLIPMQSFAAVMALSYFHALSIGVRFLPANCHTSLLNILSWAYSNLHYIRAWINFVQPPRYNYYRINFSSVENIINLRC